MKLLRSERSDPVFYANEKDLVTLSGRKKVYKRGFHPRQDGFDEQAYNAYYDRYGHAPPLDTVGDVKPNRQQIKPGIEIMLAKDNPSLFYATIDGAGLDNPNSLAPSLAMRTRRRITHDQIDSFLEEELYRYDGSPSKHGRHLLRLISESLEYPELFFNLHVLEENKAKWVGYDTVNLSAAIDKGVRIDIDWTYANKILAIHYMNKKS